MRFGSPKSVLLEYALQVTIQCHLSTGESLCAGLLKLVSGCSEVKWPAVLCEAIEFPQSHSSRFFFSYKDSLAWTLSQQLTVTDAI